MLPQQTENRPVKQTNGAFGWFEYRRRGAHQSNHQIPAEYYITRQIFMKTKKDQIDRKDWKFMEQLPYGDPDFSEEHNRRVIAEVDAWNDKMDKRRDREFKEKTQERTSAAARYLKNVADGKGVSVETYFGKRYLAYLRGEEIVNQLKANPALVEKLRKKMEKRGDLKPL